MKQCPKCNTNLTKDDTFCPECGAKLKTKQSKRSNSSIIIAIIAVITLIVIIAIFLINLNREEPIVETCKSPYIEFKAGECCLDTNMNNICDNDEKTESIVVEESSATEEAQETLKEPSQLPADFFRMINVHPELQGLENEQPVGGQIDADSLSILKQQFPQVYANAKVGDYLLRYQTKLIIYDYNTDTIINAVALG